MSKLLLDEYPLIILPSLAVAVGLNEAIVLQQVHYWLIENRQHKRNGHYRDGCWWTFNSYEKWQAQFPFWSVMTIRRAFDSLERAGLLRSAQLMDDKRNKTKWYTIDYAAFARVTDASVQNEQTGSVQDEHLQAFTLNTSLTESSPETSTEGDMQPVDPTRGMTDLERRAYYGNLKR